MIALAALFAYYTNTGFNVGTSNFNFYNSSLQLNGTMVTETLHFMPDQPYHTLFRTFTGHLSSSGNNTISILNVSCKEGTPYYRTYDAACYNFGYNATNSCLPNTENNEYGCTFGDVLGFNTGSDYWVTAKYALNPSNLFLINGKYYIKFVPYSANNHVDLKTGENFFVSGGIANDEYLPNENVTIYVPYGGSTQGFNVITQTGFEFSNNQFNLSKFILDMLIFLLPLILFDAIWILFGREKIDPPVPSQLSDIPTERSPWEVSAYFNPPFSSISKTFYSTLMLDFYRRKIIDVSYTDKGVFNKKLMVKINGDPGNLDDIETKYLGVLKKLDENCPAENKDAGYFDVNKSLNQFSMRYSLRGDFMDISKSVKQDGNKFISVKGFTIFVAVLALIFFGSLFFAIVPLALSSIILGIIITVMHSRNPILIRYNGDFYGEYKDWAAFKKGISHSISMKDAKSDAVVLWEKYLVYATALGVADKVLKQFKGMGVIDQQRLNAYSGVYIASSAFSTSVAQAGGGGGGGGGGR